MSKRESFKRAFIGALERYEDMETQDNQSLGFYQCLDAIFDSLQSGVDHAPGHSDGIKGEITTHELKIWPEYFEAVRNGSKTFEVRVNDRGFKKNDKVILNEYDPSAPECYAYSDRSISATIGFVIPIDEKRVVFSLLNSSDDSK